jgi:hypothetical protein
MDSPSSATLFAQNAYILFENLENYKRQQL